MSRSLTLIVPLALIVVMGGVVVYALLPSPPPAAVGTGPAATGAAAGLPAEGVAPAAARPRAGRTLALADAVKELDLIRPARQRLAEDFRLPLVDGKAFRLADQRGRVVLINFWATWCPPCREEMPAMERLWRQHRGGRFVLVAVSVDANPDVVAPFVATHGFSFPIALDPRMETANAYGVRALPSSFVVDRGGALAGLALGPRIWDSDAAHSVVEALSR